MRIVGAEIIRDVDGLAMSSRNVYLTSDQRQQALGIHKAILCSTEEEMRHVLEDHGLTIEYAVIRDEQTLLEPKTQQQTRALVAVNVGNTRLIDNAPVSVQ